MRDHVVMSVCSIIMAVMAALSFVLYSSSKMDNEKNTILAAKVHKLQADKAYYQGAIKNYNAKKINTKIRQDNINLDEKTAQTRDRIKQGITMAYNDTKTQADYDRLKTELKPLLGPSFTDKILDLDKPTVSQSGKAQFAFGKLNSVRVAFSQYDFSDNNVAVYVTVNYSSPEIDATNTGDVGSKKSVVNNGQDIFALNYNAKKDTLELKNYQKGVQQGVSG